MGAGSDFFSVWKTGVPLTLSQEGISVAAKRKRTKNDITILDPSAA